MDMLSCMVEIDAASFCLAKPDRTDITLVIVEVYSPDKRSSLKIQTDVPFALTVRTDKVYYLYAMTQQDHDFYFFF